MFDGLQYISDTSQSAVKPNSRKCITGSNPRWRTRDFSLIGKTFGLHPKILGSSPSSPTES